MTNNYTWTDNPTVSGVALCDTDVLNDCLMHLKYENINLPNQTDNSGKFLSTNGVSASWNTVVQSPITSICTSTASTVSSASQSSPAVVIENYVNGASWYRVWSDGWVEQGGALSGSMPETVTFLKPFLDTNYTLVNPHMYAEAYATTSVTKLSTSFTVEKLSQFGMISFAWYACGY